MNMNTVELLWHLAGTGEPPRSIHQPLLSLAALTLGWWNGPSHSRRTQLPPPPIWMALNLSSSTP